jgi:hypothetical protein
VSDRHKLAFVALAAIGTYFVAYGIASGVALDFWSSGRLGIPSGPPRLEPTLAVGTFAGGFVAWRLGGWRGVLAFAALGVIGALRHLIPVIQCAAGDAAICKAMKDLDFVIPQLWLVPGLVLGVTVATFVRAQIPLRFELEALGVFALALPVRWVVASLPFYLPLFRDSDGLLRYRDELLAVDVALVVAAALWAAVFLLRRSTRPRDAGLLLAAVLVVLGLLRLRYLLVYAPGGDTLELIDQLSDFLAAALIVVVTAFSQASRSRALRPALTRLLGQNGDR